MNGPTHYLTVAEAALFTGRSERTIRRWMNNQLLAIYRRGDGILVLDVKELARIERQQRNANPTARSKKRAATFALVRPVDLSS
jgi:hypothetical protein